MSSEGSANSFVLALADFDRSLLPSHARSPGTELFTQEVIRYFQREYAEFGGFVRVIVTNQTIEVNWTADSSKPDPRDVIHRCLRDGEFKEAIRLLTVFLRHNPGDFQSLYNLGLVLSDTREAGQAEGVLRAAIKIKPDDVDAQIALGVSIERQKRTEEAVLILREAVQKAPDNSWGNLNLGACLAKLGQHDEAESYLRRSLALNPTDQRALFNLAKLLILTDRESEADPYLIEIIQQGEHTPLAEAAEKERSRLAHKTFRAKTKGSLRPDALMYLLGAIEKFSAMAPVAVRDIGFEIAQLGRQGLDVNDSTQRYQLTKLPGRFSALHLLCLMYAAFRQVLPDADIGFDLSQEYAAAVELHGERNART